MPDLYPPGGGRVALSTSDERAKRLLAAGWTAASTTVDKPPPSAVKAEWVAYAVSQGADESEASALTKADLQQQYG